MPEKDAVHAIDAGFTATAEIHRLMSFHEAGSELSRLNRDAFDHPQTVHSHTFAVIRSALEIADASDGLFDITIAPSLVAWGFLPKPQSRYAPDPSASWRDIELTGGQVRFHKPLWIDLGGIAKGYAVDCAMQAMACPPDIQCHVDAGGDLRVAGPAPERVALRAATDQGDDLPVIDIENGSIASSSGWEGRKLWNGQEVGPHLDGRARRSVGTRSFVSVVAERCAIADPLTKVVLAAGASAAGVLRRYGATAHLHSARDGWRSLGVGI